MEITSNRPLFDGELIGTVLSYDEKSRELICYVPKIMSGLPSERLVETQVQTNGNFRNITGYTNYKPTLKIRNGVKLKSWDTTSKIPKTGVKIEVKYFEGYPKLGFWKDGFNPDGQLEVIDKEKYDKLFKLKVGNQSVDIYNDDNLTLEFNSDKVILNKNEKDSLFRINIPDEIFTGPSIPKKLSEGKLWFNTIEKKLYIYYDEKLHRLVEDDLIDDIYDYLEKLGKRVVNVKSFDNEYLTEENNGKVFSDNNDFIIYTESEVYDNPSGYQLIPSKNLFLKDGISQTGFKRVIYDSENEIYKFIDLNGKIYKTFENPDIEVQNNVDSVIYKLDLTLTPSTIFTIIEGDIDKANLDSNQIYTISFNDLSILIRKFFFAKNIKTSTIEKVSYQMKKTYAEDGITVTGEYEEKVITETSVETITYGIYSLSEREVISYTGNTIEIDGKEELETKTETVIDKILIEEINPDLIENDKLKANYSTSISLGRLKIPDFYQFSTTLPVLYKVYYYLDWANASLVSESTKTLLNRIEILETENLQLKSDIDIILERLTSLETSLTET